MRSGSLIQLLQDSGRAEEAARLAEILIEQEITAGRDDSYLFMMLQGKYEEALELLIERTRNGKPPAGFTGVRSTYFMLEDLPGYETLESLIQEWRKEQRALYDELTAARASTEDAAHP